MNDREYPRRARGSLGCDRSLDAGSAPDDDSIPHQSDVGPHGQRHAARLRGSGTVDDNGRITGRLVVDTTSIDTKNKRRDAHLRDADFFDVEKYPAMIFEVTGASLDRPGQCAIKGALTIRGVTRPVEFPAAVRRESDGSITIDARAGIDRSKWGLTWSMMGAGLENHVTIEATFVRLGVA